MNRRLARLRAVQALFQMDVAEAGWREAVENSLEPEETADEFINEVVSGINEHKQDIDARLKKHLDHWTLERIGNVDRAILREAVYEMIYMDSIPLHVSVNEAIELAKAFGGSEAGRFANGVLSSLLKEHEEN
ncbi:transcription antitermination factor NusB [Alteribacillus sp. HJP-4]|uniref:transcription antitermination factor NusB n=1 Tax=Alteribacillus sp. HJP-4 TaxID=2775394 RepID=UPI0035CCCA8E